MNSSMIKNLLNICLLPFTPGIQDVTPNTVQWIKELAVK